MKVDIETKMECISADEQREGGWCLYDA